MVQDEPRSESESSEWRQNTCSSLSTLGRIHLNQSMIVQFRFQNGEITEERVSHDEIGILIPIGAV